MKGILFWLMLLACAGHVNAQKKLDTAVVNKWEQISEVGDGYGKVSNNGKYIIYATKFSGKVSYYAKSVDGKWQVRIGGNPMFTADNKNALSLSPDGVLEIQQLGKPGKETIPKVISFQLHSSGKQEFLIYRKAGAGNVLVAKNLSTGLQLAHKDVANFFIVGDHQIALSRTNGTRETSLETINLATGNIAQISKEDEPVSSVWKLGGANGILFKNGAGYRIWGANEHHLNGKVRFSYLGGDLEDVKISKLSPSGNLISFTARQPGLRKLGFDPSIVRIFNYKDQSFKLNKDPLEAQPFSGLLDLTTGRVIDLGNAMIQDISKDENVLIAKISSGHEYYWNVKQLEHCFYLVRERGNWTKQNVDLIEANISPDNKFIIGRKETRGDLYSYGINSKKLICLTDQLPIPLGDELPIDPSRRSSKNIVITPTWFDDQHILLEDRYDLWKVDVSGTNEPLNLTGGYGRKNHVVLRLFDKAIDKQVSNYQLKQAVFLYAFNEETKDCGFFKVILGKPHTLELLSMGPYNYAVGFQKPARAVDRDIWLVTRSQASSSYNLFWTSNFKDFSPLTDIHPERDYVWFTTELVNYQTKSGVKCQAILYKPKNLDPTRKYPVLFNFYEQRTEGLNQYLTPNYLNSERGGYEFNFPLMLAEGYLICVPDIRFKLGETARSIVDCVDGAADEIAKRPYVDSSGFGACGGSFGGYSVNCLAALSNKFKALVPISGISDLISQYGNIPGMRDEHVENRQGRMEVSLGSDPERYLWNSPIAYSKQVNTPVLIVNTLYDGSVNVQQGIEWFISLRREGKPAWMLQYQVDDHGISSIEHQKDLYGRMKDFFGHYLKGESLPIWMKADTYQ